MSTSDGDVQDTTVAIRGGVENNGIGGASYHLRFERVSIRKNILVDHVTIHSRGFAFVDHSDNQNGSALLSATVFRLSRAGQSGILVL